MSELSTETTNRQQLATALTGAQAASAAGPASSLQSAVDRVPSQDSSLTTSLAKNAGQIANVVAPSLAGLVAVASSATEKTSESSGLFGTLNSLAGAVFGSGNKNENNTCGSFISRFLEPFCGKSAAATIGQFIDEVVKAVEKEKQKQEELAKKLEQDKKLSPFDLDRVEVNNLNREKVAEQRAQQPHGSVYAIRENRTGDGVQPALNALTNQYALGTYDEHKHIPKGRFETSASREDRILAQEAIKRVVGDLKEFKLAEDAPALSSVLTSRETIDIVAQAVKKIVDEKMGIKTEQPAEGPFRNLRLPRDLASIA